MPGRRRMPPRETKGLSVAPLRSQRDPSIAAWGAAQHPPSRQAAVQPPRDLSPSRRHRRASSAWPDHASWPISCGLRPVGLHVGVFQEGRHDIAFGSARIAIGLGTHVLGRQIESDVAELLPKRDERSRCTGKVRLSIITCGMPASSNTGPSIDPDDKNAAHLVAVSDGHVVATLRIVCRGRSAKIGRMAAAASPSNNGIGKFAAATLRNGVEVITLGAQQT
jgi:hypothetical protein